MNYRHDYHAGNFADVLKHVVLTRVLTYMKLKPQPFRVIDTHAGAGRYDLQGNEAEKTGEWRDGIGRVVEYDFSTPVAELIAPYLAAVQALNAPRVVRIYPGSPLIAQHLLRAEDRLVANELRQDDFLRLKAEFRRSKQTAVLNIDAWHAVKSLLPPKERRGVILIDPPFEERDEFQKLAEGLAEAWRRFPAGVYLVWYPVKDVTAVQRLEELVIAERTKVLDVRLATRTPFPGLGLTETGVLVVNPPYPLERELNLILPELAKCLADGAGQGFCLRNFAA